MLTLPDYLKPGLDIIFVGINPGFYSAQVGRYFARRTNRFWPAFNAAGFVPFPMSPEEDYRLLEFGIGLTDVVKRATRNASELTPAEMRAGAQTLHTKLIAMQPLAVCFNGIMGYKAYLKANGGAQAAPAPGLQPVTMGRSVVFVIPSTSPANAATPLQRIIDSLTELKLLINRLKAADV